MGAFLMRRDCKINNLKRLAIECLVIVDKNIIMVKCF